MLGGVGDAFGGENGVDAGISEEVCSGDSEEEAELLQCEQLHFSQFLVDVGHLLDEVRGHVVGQDVLLVHIFPAPLIINQSNYAIENGFHLLQLLPRLIQTADGPLHHALRLLVAVEEGEELVHDIRFAVFLSRL